MNYDLMNKDNRLLSFRTEYKLGDTIVTETARYTDRLPIGFTDISLWIENRNYAKHKESLKGYLTEWGMDKVDGFIEITHCLGLNDTLWVKPSGSKLLWADVSLYTNDFSDVMEKTAFGTGLNGIAISSTDLTSPEFVSPGSFAKCWRREDDGIYLYKAAGTLSQGYEPFSEYFSSQIADSLSLSSVHYELTKFNGRLCTRCKMFTSEKIGLVPFAGVYDISKKRYNIPAIISACDEMGFGDEIRKMYLLDCLTLNQDRHLGNIGFLFDNDTFEIIGLSPIYDFNVSMLCDARPEDLASVHTIDNYIASNKISPKASDASFYEVATALDIELPANISFTQHARYRMDDARFAALSEYIHLNFERIRHKNNGLRRHEDTKQIHSLADHLEELHYQIKDDRFQLELTWEDFHVHSFLKPYATLYGIAEDETIIINVLKTGEITCSLKDEFGESEIGTELLGDRDAFIKAVISFRLFG